MRLLRQILFTLIIFVDPGLSRINGQDSGFDLKLLDQAAHRVISVRDTTKGFEDLGFLKQALAGADIVFLGEPSHGDGTTFEAKSRLVRFLHEEMDFDVLAFESSVTDCHLIWKEILQGADPLKVAAKSVFKFWADSKYTTGLFNYIGQRALTDDPLILAGMDMQLSDPFPPLERRKQIIDFLNKGPGSVRIARLPSVDKLLEEPERYFRIKSQLYLDSLDQASLMKELNRVAVAWERKPWCREDAPLYRYFVNVPRWLYVLWNIDIKKMDAALLNIRDQEMAKNLIWLKEQVYPDKKIIVWGANSHFGFNRQLLQPLDYMIPMGKFVKERYGDRSYTISFTAFDGMTFPLHEQKLSPVPPADSLSLEHALYDLGITYGFLDMRDPKVRQALGDRFIARIYGYQNWSGEWARMTDGIFFINTMEANELREVTSDK